MSGARSLVRLAFPLGLALGWLVGAWAWTRWTPFSAVRLAQVRAAELPGEGLWTHAASPLDPGGTLALRPALETVLASARITRAEQRIALPSGSSRYLCVQLVDARGVTLDVLEPGEAWPPASTAPLGAGESIWCLARARVLPGEDPGLARAAIDAIAITPAPGD